MVFHTKTACYSHCRPLKRFIERKLKLKVNEAKSRVAKTDRTNFLGFTFHTVLFVCFHSAQIKNMVCRHPLFLEGGKRGASVWTDGYDAHVHLSDPLDAFDRILDFRDQFLPKTQRGTYRNMKLSHLGKCFHVGKFLY